MTVRISDWVAGILTVAVLACGMVASPAWAESDGQADMDEALRLRVTARGLPDLNNVIDKLQSALDKGLEVEDAEFAEQMLSSALMERATTLMQVVNSNSIQDDRIKQILRLVVSDLRRVLAYDDPPAEAYLMLGRLMALPGGDPHESRRLLTKFVESEETSDEEKAEAYVLRGQVQTDEKKALADFDQAVKLAPDNPQYGLMRAVYLRSKNKLEDALTATGQLIEQSPEDANAKILEGEILRQLDKKDLALESFEKAIELSPETPGPYQERGEILREQGKLDEAIKAFSKVIELQPGSVLPLIHRAEAYLNTGELEKALADVDTVLKEQQVVAAHRLRGEILAQMNRLDEAIEEIEQLSRSIPNQPELKMQLALYYLIAKKPQDAISAYDDVLLLDPENFNALRGRGDAYLNVGKHAEAIRDFEAALKIEPDDTSLLNNLAWVLATSPEAELRDGKRAVELATKACELTEYKMPHILSTLAAAFAESGNFDTAIQWSQKAVDLDDTEQEAQLAKELSSYQKKEPWRERQTLGGEVLTGSETAPSSEAEPANKDAESSSPESSSNESAPTEESELQVVPDDATDEPEQSLDF